MGPSLRIPLFVGFLAATGLLARAQAVAAPVPFVDLKYDVDPALPGCPAASDFRALVAAQLGYDPFRNGAPLGVVVHAWQGEQGTEGRLDWQSEKPLGERRFTSPNQTCREVIPAMGFALAVQIQMMASEAQAEEVSPPADGVGAAPPEPATQPLPTPSIAPAPEERTPASDAKPTWSFYGGAGASAALGLGPRVAGLGRLLAAARHEQLLLELGGEASWPSTTRIDGGGAFRHQVILGTAAACLQRSALLACGLGKLGALRVQGLDVDKPSSPQGFIAQVGPRLGWPVLVGDHLGLLLRMEALYRVTPWTVELNHVGAWTMPRFGVGVGIDVFVRGE